MTALLVWCEKAAEGGESKTRAGLWSAPMMSATSSDNTSSSASERPCIENGDKAARRATWRGILPRHVQDLGQIRGVRGDRLSPFTPNRLTFADSGPNSHRARVGKSANMGLFLRVTDNGPSKQLVRNQQVVSSSLTAGSIANHCSPKTYSFCDSSTLRRKGKSCRRDPSRCSRGSVYP